jgi:hypothetical protein
MKTILLSTLLSILIFSCFKTTSNSYKSGWTFNGVSYNARPIPFGYGERLILAKDTITTNVVLIYASGEQLLAGTFPIDTFSEVVTDTATYFSMFDITYSNIQYQSIHGTNDKIKISFSNGYIIASVNNVTMINTYDNNDTAILSGTFYAIQ